MKFTEYYKSIENKRKRIELRDRITEHLGIFVNTFYNWLARGKVPQKHHRAIAEILDKPIDSIFPEI